MPDTIDLRPIPDLRPVVATMTDGQRLRHLIEGHQRFTAAYGRAYGNVVDALETVRAGRHPQIAALPQEKRDELEATLRDQRDEVARGFTQSLLTIENAANELMPGTFPRADEPFTSFDLGEWFGKVLDWLREGLDLFGDFFDAVGLDTIGDGLHWAADRLDDLHDFGAEHDLWTSNDDDDDDS